MSNTVVICCRVIEVARRVDGNYILHMKASHVLLVTTDLMVLEIKFGIIEVEVYVSALFQRSLITSCAALLRPIKVGRT